MTVLAIFVAVADVAQFSPQALRVFRFRHDADALSSLSIPTWIVATLQSIAWIVYGLARHLPAVAFPNLLIAPICAGILIVCVHRRHAHAMEPLASHAS